MNDVSKDITVKRTRGRKRAKADDILLAAREVFMEHGYGGATTDAIQMRAGVSKSTLYSYFSTKEDLFKAVCSMRSIAFEDFLRSAVMDETDPERFLNRFGVGFLTYLLSDEGASFYRLMVDASKQFPQLGKFFYSAGIKASSDMIERYIATAHDEGRIQVDWPALSAEHFMGMLKGDLHLRAILNIGKPPTDRQIEHYVSATVDRFLKAHARRA